MKARVRATGRIIDVSQAEGSFFVDKENNHYKCDELDFNVADECDQLGMLAESLANKVNESARLQLLSRVREVIIYKLIDKLSFGGIITEKKTICEIADYFCDFLSRK